MAAGNLTSALTRVLPAVPSSSVSCPSPQGVVPIIMSWFFSPILTGATSAFILWIVRTTVLRRKNALNLVFWVPPPAVLICTYINVFFVL